MGTGIDECRLLSVVCALLLDWRGSDRLVAVGDADGDGQPVLEITLDGSVETIGSVRPFDPAYADLAPTLSPDGERLAW